MVYSNRPKGLVPSLYIIGEDMTVTHKTLEHYLQKCKEGQGRVAAALEQVRESVVLHEKQEAIIFGQITALEHLMDYDNTVPIVEVPIIDEEAMEVAHEKRLDMFDNTTPEEFFEGRKDSVYKREAMDFVETIDAINNEEAE